eukprot:CAMPEP_0115000310 /NCGR_PEP_ID=MMETSP0216-20121206/16679_1 /TAXON_ID=223996 /ORGANISM="Protocruzia adherens, Strain Boccale" /LENGTH=136 /DNA_ID=CAMNT_0002365379 /DNA_START=473 /DNA_END=883 /DNA_ORIENTATION=+
MRHAHETSEGSDLSILTVSNNQLNIYTRVDSDGGDFLDFVGGGGQINNSLVDFHLETIPGVGTFSIGGLSGGDVQVLGGHSDGTGNLQLSVLSVLDDLGASGFQRFDFTTSEGHSNLMEGLLLSFSLSFLILGGHL